MRTEALTQLEKDIMEWVKAYPNRTPEDVTSSDTFKGVDNYDIHHAITYLTMEGYLKQDRVTQALTVR